MLWVFLSFVARRSACDVVRIFDFQEDSEATRKVVAPGGVFRWRLRFVSAAALLGLCGCAASIGAATRWSARIDGKTHYCGDGQQCGGSDGAFFFHSATS